MNHDMHISKWGQLAREFLGDEFWSDITSSVRVNVPKSDVYHTNREVRVLIDLPGLEKVQDLEIRVEGETLYVKGFIPDVDRLGEPVISERFTGSFERVIPLGTAVKGEERQVRYRKGVLEIRLPL
ncbi:Hsp20/alpha crystallin family protein [Kroppenstedtia pulmonis]|uniref:Hsp20/alpha crystallin family protein n=1 Tax=Kroppenstedtia pulmonis TaxID=1380685 RepID=A0A7D4BI86_9BACL|nr:Hsp20/alpha crystallin family protein [Kroppenstedtia pulmonis]QKG83450.1 Hsp20/alpha crystallin family protein [Kroppenstedtia pulmonis]